MEKKIEHSQSRFDSLWVGLIFGFLSPIISLLMIYSSSFSRATFLHFIKNCFESGTLINVLISCLIPDLLVFALFIWRNHYKSAKGIVISSASLTALLVIYKITLMILS